MTRSVRPAFREVALELAYRKVAIVLIVGELKNQVVKRQSDRRTAGEGLQHFSPVFEPKAAWG